MASSSNASKGWLLLLCGSSRLNDHAMIGDFAGLMYHLQNDFAIMGDFMTSVDLKKYVNTPPYSDIKFGRGSETRIVYSRFQAQHRDQPFQYIDPTDIKRAFAEWLKDKVTAAKSGDFVTIIIITHGRADGCLALGTNWLKKKELSNVLEKFASGVQVNVITNACFSSQIKNSIAQSNRSHRYIQAAAGTGQYSWAAGKEGWTEHDRSVSGRYRDFYFTESLIKSLLKISKTRKAPEKLKGQYNLAQHFQELHVGTNVNPPAPVRSNPEHFTDWLMTNTLCQVLHLDFVSLNPLTTSRARAGTRAAAPAQEEPSFSTSSTVTPDSATGGMLSVIKSEASKVSGKFCIPHDQPLWTTLDHLAKGRIPLTSEKIRENFCQLYWRVGVQEVFFEALLFLHDKCLVDLSGLQAPVDVTVLDDDAQIVYEALNTFPYVDTTQQSNYTAAFYSTPAMWLSIMIVRGAIVKSFKPIAQRLHMRGCFGPWNAKPGLLIDDREYDVWDEAAYDEEFPEDVKIRRNGKCGYIPQNTPSVCGFLIPRLVEGEDGMEVREKASRIFGSAVKKYDGVWDKYRESS